MVRHFPFSIAALPKNAQNDLIRLYNVSRTQSVCSPLAVTGFIFPSTYLRPNRGESVPVVGDKKSRITVCRHLFVDVDLGQRCERPLTGATHRHFAESTEQHMHVIRTNRNCIEAEIN